MDTMEITTQIGCKNNCGYCPQDKLMKAYTQRSNIIRMSFDTFKTCIDKIPKQIIIEFSGMCEPWINPECSKMLLYAHEKGHKIGVFTTLSGMKERDIDTLASVDLKRFMVYLPSEENCENINVDENYLVVLSRLLHSTNKASYSFNGKKVHPKISSLMNNNLYGISQAHIHSRANNISLNNKKPPEKLTGIIGCRKRLNANILLPNGDVILCCMDYGIKHVLGNLLVCDYDSLFRGEEFKKIKIGLWNESKDILCRHCDVSAYNVVNKFLKQLSWYVRETYSRIRLIWSLIKLFPRYIYHSFFQLVRYLPQSKKNIVISFDDANMFGATHNSGREAYYILKAFSDGGYNVYFYHQTDFKSYHRLRKLGRLIYTINNLKFISKLPSDTHNYIYGFDTIRPDFLQLRWERMIYFNVRKANTYRIGNVIPMPFYMFPLIYATGADKEIFQYRNLTRKYRVFFAGDLNRDFYDYSFFKQKYPEQITRVEALNLILESKLRGLFIKGTEEFKKSLNDHDFLDRFLIVQTGYPPKIKSKQWMRILGQSDFFICFSGSGYPICHNSIEAMAVGSIPIIAYSDWFDPQLEHNKNAIIYSGEQDLIKKIEFALHMPQEEILKLRKGVFEYYDRYLANGCLASKYETNAQSISTLMLFTHITVEPKCEAEGRIFVQEFDKLVHRRDKLFSKQSNSNLEALLR